MNNGLANTMISVSDAKNRLLKNIPAPRVTILSLAEAAGFILAEDVYAPMDMPPFRQSSMDGYALAYHSLQEGSPLPVRAVIQAGTTELPLLGPGEAMRIFTGAPVPEGADTVVMQEKVTVADGKILVEDPQLQPGANVRPQAAQTAKGELAATRGTRLGPGIIGFLASLGIARVKVYGVPKTGILVTGKELISPGEPLMMGQVYESNSFTLRAALSEAGILPHMLSRVEDEAALIYAAIEEGLAACQLLLITGGISVGDYDFVYQALQQAGVETIFYKVKQKPGKPLYCGRKGKTLVFGLPGNPGSVLSCFYQYVVPAIRQMKGMDPAIESKVWKSLAADFTKRPGLTHFLKAKSQDEWVQLLQAQESYKMNAFVQSDCLVQLDEEKSVFKKGDKVRVYPLNQLWG